MRAVFVGASQLTVLTAQILIGRGHEVVIIDSDRERIDELSDELDCSFLHGDGGTPEILREVGPGETDILLCLTDNDQANIISALIGKSLEFDKVVPSILNPTLQPICRELGLADVIIPDQTIGRHLADMVEGIDVLELSTIIKNEARFFSFVVVDDERGTVRNLELPAQTRAICLYRDGDLVLTDEDSNLCRRDEVVLLTHSRHLGELLERWPPTQAEVK